MIVLYMHAESTPPQQKQQQLSRTEEKYQQKKNNEIMTMISATFTRGNGF